MSYVLFAETSNPFGTRETWITNIMGVDQVESGADDPVGLVEGNPEIVSKSTFNDISEQANSSAAALGLGMLDTALTAPASIQTMLDGLVDDADDIFGLLSDPEGITVSFTDPTLDGERGHLEFAVDTWNAVKNAEVVIDEEDLVGVESLTLSNFVDARVQVGEVLEGGETADPDDLPERLDVEILLSKRGQFDAKESDVAVDLHLEVATNGFSWQNSFLLEMSDLDDTVVIEANDGSADLGAFQNNTNNGALTKINAFLFGGDDTFTSEGTDTRDVVFAGTGLDDITTGGNADEIVVDLDGEEGAHGVDEDPSTFGDFETVIRDFDLGDGDGDTLTLTGFEGGYASTFGFDEAFIDELNDVAPGLIDGNEAKLSTEADFTAVALALQSDGNDITDAYIVAGDDLVLDFGELRHVALQDFVGEGEDQIDFLDGDTSDGLPGQQGEPAVPDTIAVLEDYDEFQAFEINSSFTNELFGV